MKWLKLSAEEGYEQGVLAYASLLYGFKPDIQYKGDEAAWWVKGKREWLLKKVGSFDSDGSRAHRHLTRTLLSGSLSKNQDSVLYRSFFSSSMREIHLLPLISKYLVEDKRGEEREKKKEEEKERKREEKRVHPPTVTSICIYDPVDISSIIFSPSSSLITSLSISMKYDNQFLCFLPLLSSLLPNLNKLTVHGSGGVEGRLQIDLSLLQQVDTSTLQQLSVLHCSYNSLSPLSLCNLSSLHTLSLIYFPRGEGLHPLNGLSSDITRSLRKIEVRYADITDLSPLSDCDLSSLEELDLSHNPSLSSLSALRGSDLSSLKSLQLGYTDISDLSPLCECKGLVLEELDFVQSQVKDLSPLSLLDLSHLKHPIDLPDVPWWKSIVHRVWKR